MSLQTGIKIEVKTRGEDEKLAENLEVQNEDTSTDSDTLFNSQHSEHMIPQKRSNLFEDHYSKGKVNGAICGCNFTKLWISAFTGIFFTTFISPYIYWTLSSMGDIYSVVYMWVPLGVIDVLLTVGTIGIWLWCKGYLGVKEFDEDVAENLFFQFLAFLTCFDNALSATKQLSNELWGPAAFSIFKMFSVSIQCAWITTFEGVYIKNKVRRQKLAKVEAFAIIMLFYNFFLFVLDCALPYHAIEGSPIGTITLAAAIHYRLDSCIYFAYFGFGHSLEKEQYQEQFAITLLNMGSYSNHIPNDLLDKGKEKKFEEEELEKGERMLKNGASGIGRGIGYIYFTLCLLFKIIQFFADDYIPDYRMSLLTRLNQMFAIFTSILIMIGLVSAVISAHKTLRNIIDRTSSQGLWKWYIRVLWYGFCFIGWFGTIAINQMFERDWIGAVQHYLEAGQGIFQLVFLMIFHPRKSYVYTIWSAWFTGFITWLTLGNIVYAFMDVMEEYTNPHHLVPIFDEFGVAVAVAYRLLCATMLGNIREKGVWDLTVKSKSH